MKHTDIQIGALLKLKPNRADAYGMADHPYVVVTGLKFRDGYKVPFVLSRDLAFTPSDFAREVAVR